MSLRNYLKKINVEGRLVNIQAPISKIYEISGVLKKLEPETVFFHQIVEF